MTMNTLWFLFIGALAGAVAGWLTGHKMRLLSDLIVGVIGSLLGRFLFGLLGMPAGGDFGAFLAAVAGALTFLYLLRFVHLGGA